MRRIFPIIVPVLLLACFGSGANAASSNAPPAAVEHSSALDGTRDGVIAPLYLGNGSGPESYIRLVNGGSSGTTFNITVIGIPSGNTYGSGFNIAIPALSAIQFSWAEILKLGSVAGTSALTGGDTGFAFYLQDSDTAAGYQHVVYDWDTKLFENFSTCGSLLNEQLLAHNNQMILNNVHTSKLGSYPSTITIHNTSNTSVTYTLTAYNAGAQVQSGSTTISSNAGKKTCAYTGNTTVAANSSLAIPESTIEAASGCTLDSDEGYMNVVLTLASGVPQANFVHTIFNSALSGSINLSDTCAVNKVSTSTASTSSTTTYVGNFGGTGGVLGTLSVTVQTSIGTSSASSQGALASGTFTVAGQSAISLTGTYDPTSDTIYVSGGGYSLVGAVSGNVFAGGYSGPNSTSGGFSSQNATTVPATNYCGTYTGTDNEVGIFSVVTSSSGPLSGIVAPCSTSSGGESVGLLGQLTGSSAGGISSQGISFAGTLSSGTISGTYGSTPGGGSSGGGTFSGATSSCSSPPSSLTTACAASSTGGSNGGDSGSGSSGTGSGSGSGSGSNSGTGSGSGSGSGSNTGSGSGSGSGSNSGSGSGSGSGSSGTSTSYLLNFTGSFNGPTGLGSGGGATVSFSPIGTGLLCKSGTTSCTVNNSGLSTAPTSFGTEAYTSGTSVTLTATPNSGSTFVGWGGDCSGTGSCTVVMGANRNVTATFHGTCNPPPTGGGCTP